jgi:hypothetical protein
LLPERRFRQRPDVQAHDKKSAHSRKKQPTNVPPKAMARR